MAYMYKNGFIYQDEEPKFSMVYQVSKRFYCATLHVHIDGNPDCRQQMCSKCMGCET